MWRDVRAPLINSAKGGDDDDDGHLVEIIID